MAVKRRTIWMADDDWAYLVRCADDRGMNPSQLVHDLLPGTRVMATFDLNDHSPKLVDGVPPQFTIDADRPVHPMPFNTRPFTPVPKTGKKG